MPFLTTAQYNELPQAEKKIYADLMTSAANYAQEPNRRNYQPAYPNSRMADIQPEMRDAHAAISRDQGAEDGLFYRAENAARNSAQPFHENYRAYMNPYQEAVIRQLSEEGARNFNENIMPALDSRFIRLGQYGSTRHADLSTRAARDFQRELLARQHQALAAGYEKSADIYNAQQGRNLESASQLANLGITRQGARMADLNALEGVGRYKQQQRQSVLDAQYQEYLRQLEEPMRRLRAQAEIMHGLPSTGASVRQFAETPVTPQAMPSNLSNIASTLLGANLLSGRRG